jgi:hypothetical protein
MQLLSLCVISLLLCGLPVIAGIAAVQPAPPEPFRVSESKPVTTNDATFVAVAEAEWKAGKLASDNTAREIQLRITNVGKTDAVFPTFDTFGLTIRKADGTEITPVGGRNDTTFTRSVVIAAGTTYCVCRRAETKWDDDRKSATLFYYDGTGTMASFGPLPAGRYKISFWYSTTHVNGSQKKLRFGDVAIWSGKAATEELAFEILAP